MLKSISIAAVVLLPLTGFLFSGSSAEAATPSAACIRCVCAVDAAGCATCICTTSGSGPGGANCIIGTDATGCDTCRTTSPVCM